MCPRLCVVQSVCQFLHLLADVTSDLQHTAIWRYTSMQNNEIRTGNLFCLRSVTVELIVAVCLWPFSDTEAVLQASQDCSVPPSILNYAPSGQLRAATQWWQSRIRLMSTFDFVALLSPFCRKSTVAGLFHFVEQLSNDSRPYLSLVTSFHLCRSSIHTVNKVEFDSLSQSVLPPKLNMFNSVDFVESGWFLSPECRHCVPALTL